MFEKVLIANRGEIACRVMRTLRRLGVASVAVHSAAELGAQHVLAADEAFEIGPAPVEKSYLNIEAILDAARRSGAQAVHPGYGFLSENPSFVTACEQAGLVFIGPTAEQMVQFGLKHTAREVAAREGVPLLPGSGLIETEQTARDEAERIGYPVMLKATAGGGGIGMRVCHGPEELSAACEQVRRLGESHFKSGGMFVEKYIARARHIEVQIFGDGAGRVIALGERDCSAQRRNQKVLEETPAPGLSAAQRAELCACAVRLGQAVHYRSAGTVEFVYDAEGGAFYFLEVNTRLQVEHGVTEAVCGVDLVEWMLRLAAGDTAFLDAYEHRPQGYAIQARIYAEDPARNFMPCSGTLTEVGFPEDVRCDHCVVLGDDVSPFYDPLIAKLIVHGATREAAREQLETALAATRLRGIETNVEYLLAIAQSDAFRRGAIVTRTLEEFEWHPCTIEVLAGGNFSTVQDYPGRVGYWAVGVPPSGPMDSLAFRLGNRLLENDETAAGLELTVTGPTLRFHSAAWVCLAGARMTARLDGAAVAYYQPTLINAGGVLKLDAITGPGCRTYLLVRGGLDVSQYLGSRSTFTLGQFGGHAGRTLQTGDVLHLCSGAEQTAWDPADRADGLPRVTLPVLTHAWEIAVLDGPHGAPDFFTPEDIDAFYAHAWEVHYQSARTGVRLIGPKPRWARRDGGEAGLHPSNIHDNAYAIGAVDFTGDMPVILGPDGPSLGGFVCPATVIHAELWKLGQLRPGDTVRFVPVAAEWAARAEHMQDAQLAALRGTPGEPLKLVEAERREAPIIERREATPQSVAVTYRRAGDRYLLIEYGELKLDLDLRFRAHALMQTVEARGLKGILDLTPGIRSLQVHFDSRVLPQGRLMDLLRELEETLPALDALELKTRIVHLPLSWDDEATQAAIAKYMQVVRDDAPWCPSNLEFIRRINGLESIDEVKRIFFAASYLVLGLGDVYLGAPVATPVDPRHRLVTTKYNPARTWTPENAVGIGGAYLCVYGMEGPGGYQFVGRTVQMWNRYRQTSDFTEGKPWLLRFFDQLRFYPVSGEELLEWRRKLPLGAAQLKIEESTFRLRDYHAYLASIAPSAAAFKQQQQAAFEAERERWTASGEFEAASRAGAEIPVDDETELDIPAGAQRVESHLCASVWKVLVLEGADVTEGMPLAILEAMKMETPIHAPRAGRVHRVNCEPGQLVRPGHAMFVLAPEFAGED